MTTPRHPAVDAAEHLAQRFGVDIHRNGVGPSSNPTIPIHFTDFGNAQRFLAEAGGDVLWDDVRNTWHMWDGSRFARDQALAVEKIAYRTTRRMYQEAYDLPAAKDREELAKWAIRTENRRAVTAMLESAKPFVAVVPAEFDRDPNLYNVLNGTVDLPTRTLRLHSKADRLSKRADVMFDPAATCPFFLKFLDRIFEGNGELIAYIRRVFGYALTATLSVHALFICYGTGRNGKSTLLFVLRQLGGDYTVHVNAHVFTDAKSDPQGFSLVNLAGARIVTAVETGAGRRLNESLVKEATGGDPITAAPKYGREFTFPPVFKPFIATNHKPDIRGADDGIWSRPRLIPFNVRIPDDEQIPDDQMKALLTGELAGILNWALDGLKEFNRIGLADPEIVKAATEAYRQEVDILGEWIEARCETGPHLQDQAGALYDDYRALTGDDAVSKKRFGQALEEHGFPAAKGAGGVRIRTGIARLEVAHRGASVDTKVARQPDFQEVITRTHESEVPEKRATTRHTPLSGSVETSPALPGSPAKSQIASPDIVESDLDAPEIEEGDV